MTTQNLDTNWMGDLKDEPVEKVVIVSLEEFVKYWNISLVVSDHGRDIHSLSHIFENRQKCNVSNNHLFLPFIRVIER